MSGEPFIKVENVHFLYNAESSNPIAALKGINLEIQKGEYLVIIGHNGSGKTTLAKHFNALLLPTKGDVWVKGMNTKDRSLVRDIRQTVGMVFQIPDNQIVATIVEEDVAFGPENLGVPPDEIRRRVDWALEVVGMLSYRNRAPHLLSAGQKQRVAIAGVMAMKPECIVLDESTAYLDPVGRKEVLDVVKKLNKEEGITVLCCLHILSLARRYGTRIIALKDGKLVFDGLPEEIDERKFKEIYGEEAEKVEII